MPAIRARLLWTLNQLKLIDHVLKNGRVDMDVPDQDHPTVISSGQLRRLLLGHHIRVTCYCPKAVELLCMEVILCPQGVKLVAPFIEDNLQLFKKDHNEPKHYL